MFKYIFLMIFLVQPVFAALTVDWAQLTASVVSFSPKVTAQLKEKHLTKNAQEKLKADSARLLQDKGTQNQPKKDD